MGNTSFLEGEWKDQGSWLVQHEGSRADWGSQARLGGAADALCSWPEEALQEWHEGKTFINLLSANSKQLSNGGFLYLNLMLSYV